MKKGPYARDSFGQPIARRNRNKNKIDDVIDDRGSDLSDQYGGQIASDSLENESEDPVSPTVFRK